jgi:hypothetical protein
MISPTPVQYVLLLDCAATVREGHQRSQKMAELSSVRLRPSLIQQGIFTYELGNDVDLNSILLCEAISILQTHILLMEMFSLNPMVLELLSEVHKQQRPPPKQGCNTLLADTIQLCCSFRSPSYLGCFPMQYISPYAMTEIKLRLNVMESNSGYFSVAMQLLCT